MPDAKAVWFLLAPTLLILGSISLVLLIFRPYPMSRPEHKIKHQVVDINVLSDLKFSEDKSLNLVSLNGFQ